MTKSQGKETLFGILFIIAITIPLIIKAFVASSITFSDECSQIATSYRFFLGDAPLVDDWSSEQLHGVTILPFVAIYIMVRQSTDGIVIFLRLMYLLLKFLIAVYGVIKIKKNKNMVMLGILLWYFFTPYNIDSLTYQATPLIVLIFCLIVIKQGRAASLKACGGAGCLYAISILSQPFWIISYPFILIDEIIKLKKEGKDAKRKIIAFQFGIAVIFIVFCILVFSRTGLNQIKVNIAYIFGEQDHNVSSLGMGMLIYNNVLKVFWDFGFDNKVTTAVNVVYLLMLIVLKKRKQLKAGMFVCLVISVISMFFLNKAFLMNEMMIPFLWMAFENIFFVDEGERREYIKLVVLGLLFSIGTALGTNTGVLATSASLCLLACVTMFYTTFDMEKTSLLAERTSIFAVILITLFLRIYITWAGDRISTSNFNARLSYGPMNGLYVTDDLAMGYDKIWTDIDTLQPSEDDILFCGTFTPVAYLDAEVKYGTMGVPFFTLDYDRLENYFELHEDKIPSIIYYYELTEQDRSKLDSCEWFRKNYDVYSDGVNLTARRKVQVQ